MTGINNYGNYNYYNQNNNKLSANKTKQTNVKQETLNLNIGGDSLSLSNNNTSVSVKVKAGDNVETITQKIIDEVEQTYGAAAAKKVKKEGNGFWKKLGNALLKGLEAIGTAILLVVTFPFILIDRLSTVDKAHKNFDKYYK